ncbi:MAG: PKD domain-containing protein, partial [Bacteroidales bacterium]|nr:PKD domain-containing protein [Bacteroidales bacterium]
AEALAPPKFLGDWSQIDNHNADIRVDLNINSYSGNPYPADFFIRISGPDGAAKFPLNSQIANAYNDWHTMVVPVDESQWTMESGTWAALINNVNSLQLNLEYFDGSETVYMDNFCITDLPPVADFDSETLTILPDNSITFNDLSVNGVTSWNWDFGDSETSTEKNPVHTYTSTGIYDVTLTVSNHFGTDMITKTAYIEVLDDSQCTRFEDNFDNSPISSVWNFREGTWSLNSGYLRQTSNYYISGNPLAGCYGLVGSPYWQDYVMTCDFRSTDNDVIGFVFNYQDEQNMYMFYWNAQSNLRILYKWENGIGTELAQDDVPYVSNQWYQGEISSIGGEISVKINGDEIFSVSDNTYTSGIVGLYCWANNQSHYDNFRLGCEGVQINLTALLEGPYNGSEMGTNLKDNNILPLVQPFSGPPWNYTGFENLESIPDAPVTDWVFVELRDAPNAASALPATMVGQTAAFLLEDGSVVDLNGSSPLRFSIDVQDQLFAVIRQRNHLPVMTANPLSMSGGLYVYDFTTSAGQAFGTDAQKDLGGGIFGMYAGDFNADGTINSDDKSVNWDMDAGTPGYIMTDSNLDGQADNQDKNDLWIPNMGESSQVPE